MSLLCLIIFTRRFGSKKIGSDHCTCPSAFLTEFKTEDSKKTKLRSLHYESFTVSVTYFFLDLPLFDAKRDMQQSILLTKWDVVSKYVYFIIFHKWSLIYHLIAIIVLQRETFNQIKSILFLLSKKIKSNWF